MFMRRESPEGRFQSKGFLNFTRLLQEADSMRSKKIAVEDGQPDCAWQFSGKKTKGSDAGVMATNEEGNLHMVKTGVSTSLLLQAVTAYAQPDKAKAERLLGFIVGNAIRVNGQHDDIETYKQALIGAFNAYIESAEGKALVAKVATGLTMEDAWTLHKALIRPNADVDADHAVRLDAALQADAAKEVLGLATISEVIFASAAQAYNNAFQETTVDFGVTALHRLIPSLRDQAGPVMTSRMIQGGQDNVVAVEAFEDVLFAPFRAGDRANSGTDFIDTAKDELRGKLSKLNGLVSSIILRTLMGEGQDSSADNMLMITDTEQNQHIVNVDVTGFRNPRQEHNERFKSVGWQEIFEASEIDELLNLIFDSSCFNKRFTWKAGGKVNYVDEIFAAVVEVLKEKVAETALEERVEVHKWLASQTTTLVTANFETYIESAFVLMPKDRRPSRVAIQYMQTHGKQFFDSIEYAKTHLPGVKSDASAAAVPTPA